MHERAKGLNTRMGEYTYGHIPDFNVCYMHNPDLKKYQYLGPCQTSIFYIIMILHRHILK